MEGLPFFPGSRYHRAVMNIGTRTPQELARRLAARTCGAPKHNDDMWKRESFSLPRQVARAKAREIFDRFPKAAYMTEIEFWRETPEGEIEFTMRRLPSAD